MDPMQFLDILDSSLSEAELSALCRQFSVAYGAFPGASKRDRTREFLGYIRRQGRMAGLAEATVALRPDLAGPVAQLFEGKEEELAWLDQVAGGEGGAMESGLTWRWSASSASRVAGMNSTDHPTATPDGGFEQTLDPPLHAESYNLYTPGLKVANDAMFFGRMVEREHLGRQLTKEGHVAVVGGRGFGGSSLLLSVARSMEEDGRFLPGYVDMKDHANHSMPGLLNNIWTQWWGRVKPGNLVPVRTLAEFVTAVRKLNVAGYKPLLFLDELEQLAWRPRVFNDNLLNAWYELGNERLLGFAVTGHASPADLLVQGELNSKFYELFQQLDLGLLDEQAARDLLTMPSLDAGLTLPDGAVDHLLAQAGPHPFFLHLAGYYLFDALSNNVYSRSEVTDRFESAAEPYWQELWDSISPLAQAHYPSRHIKVTVSMSVRQLRILDRKGLVIADNTGFRPFSEGFARWLRRMRAATEAAAAVANPAPV